MTAHWPEDSPRSGERPVCDCLHRGKAGWEGGWHHREGCVCSDQSHRRYFCLLYQYLSWKSTWNQDKIVFYCCNKRNIMCLVNESLGRVRGREGERESLSQPLCSLPTFSALHFTHLWLKGKINSPNQSGKGMPWMVRKEPGAVSNLNWKRRQAQSTRNRSDSKHFNL